jgi:hypothetical protein
MYIYNTYIHIYSLGFQATAARESEREADIATDTDTDIVTCT